MLTKHLFTFYCTLLVPLGALVGLGVGRATGFPAAFTLSGVGVGIALSFLLLRSTTPDDTP